MNPRRFNALLLARRPYQIEFYTVRVTRIVTAACRTSLTRAVCSIGNHSTTAAPRSSQPCRITSTDSPTTRLLHKRAEHSTVAACTTRPYALPVRFGIYMPAFNAAHTLPGVIARIPAPAWDLCDDFVVVDGGSTDATAAVIDELADRHAAIRRISLATNQGYGAAVRTGLTALADSPADYFACLHADGQYPPEMLETLVHHAHTEGFDILQGSRHLDGTARAGGMPIYKLLAGRALCAIENAAFGLKLTDYHSGYLVLSRRVVECIDIDRLSGYFDFDLELIAAARQRGLNIGELGIPTHYGSEVSYLNPAIYGVRVLVVVAKYLCGAYR